MSANTEKTLADIFLFLALLLMLVNIYSCGREHGYDKAKQTYSTSIEENDKIYQQTINALKNEIKVLRTKGE